MQNNIKILDCTLRDGGYVNDWMFGYENIQSIVDDLGESGIDFIECGFLKDCIKDSNKTFFSSIEELTEIINPSKNYTLMVNYGEYNIGKFPQCKNTNIKIRVAFKKHNQEDALEYIKELKNLGWEVFANPMITNIYSKQELLFLISRINSIKPFGVSIVDTLGNMSENDVIQIFKLINEKLHPEIALGFHSHNSMQLSFSNTKTLLNLAFNRVLIIDSCLYGMGRGAGNLCTELITKYLNDNNNGSYKMLPLLKLIDKYLKPIYQKTPWGYSTPFYIAAIYGCHPNYAQALVNLKISDEKIDEILKKIPEEKKTIFDKNFIQNFIPTVI